MSGKKEESAVRVFARFRPVLRMERRKKNVETEFSIQFAEDERTMSLTQTRSAGTTTERTYTFDHVFGPKASQAYVFERMAQETVDDVVQGFNGTIFAYGQTGSGKTYSMFGPTPIREPEDRGIIPRCCEYLFDELQTAEEIRQVTIKCSFVEIYKERLRDLLKPAKDGSQSSLRIRETPHGSVQVVGVTEEYVSSPAEVMELLARGNQNRTVSRTKMNQFSSRSHSLLAIVVTQKLQDASIRIGKLNLADLAGSERVMKSGLKGTRLSEAKKINQSLSALGNCINALTDKKRNHVPFRDSKLTFLLKDSLGGNTKTSLLVNCSPHAANSDETLSTLLFAQRAKHVKNSVHINRQLSVNELQSLVAQLRQQLADSRAEVKSLRNKKKGSRHSAEVQEANFDYEDFDTATEHAARTLPSRPHEAAALYAALGQLAMGGQVDAAEIQRLSEHNLKQLGGGPKSNHSFDDMALLSSALGMAHRTAIDDPELAAAAAQSALAVGGQSSARSAGGQVGVRVTRGKGGESGEYDNIDGADEDTVVMRRAKEAIQRSLAARTLDQNGNFEDDDELEEEESYDSLDSDFSDSDPSVNDEDMERRAMAKKRLEEELAAARRRREDMREVQRKRSDHWAAKKAESESEPKRTERKWKSVRDTSLVVLTDALDALDGPEQEVWSPVDSPIPPPPSYPYPVAPDSSPDEAEEEEEDDSDDFVSTYYATNSYASTEGLNRLGKSKRHPVGKARSSGTLPGASRATVDDMSNHRRSQLQHAQTMREPRHMARPGVATGRIELRVDLVHEDGADGLPESLGYIELDAADDPPLVKLREKINAELDELPTHWVFTRRSVPVGVRQEKKRTSRYVRTVSNVITLRVDDSFL